MSSWGDLLETFGKLGDSIRQAKWLQGEAQKALNRISVRRENRNVILYGSGFLQKVNAPASTIQLNFEDINGFMSVVYKMDCSKGLTLLIHTPGGVTNAVETVMDYLWSKFPYIETIVPVYAMSAGTMMSLATKKIIMGRQSQLGPIDPQMPYGGTMIPAGAIIEQFDEAKQDILAQPLTAHAWAPILQNINPAVIRQARDAIAYGEKIVRQYLEKHMFSGQPNAANLAEGVASYFNTSAQHKSHGRRIGRDEARSKSVVIEDLESDQELQDAVLTVYHLATIMFEKGPCSKIIDASTGQRWVKNLEIQRVK